MDNLTILRFYGERQYSSIHHQGEARMATWRIGATTIHKVLAAELPVPVAGLLRRGGDGTVRFVAEDLR
ncbi:hypothetical protein [Streptomyces sp. NPDC059957]|uniref:hypothetical protein n=1 Tax=unclassified Streptomyces TaxID=2593676 RepID=UPI00364DAAFF